MTAEQTAIKTAYEVVGMSPIEIAEDRQLEEAAVKAALMNCSSKYRKDCGVELMKNEDFLNFTDDQLDSVNKVIFETALSAEHPDGTVDYKTRLAAATYIRDDKKGRKEAVKHLANGPFNIFQFNQQINSVREKLAPMRERLIGNA